MSLKKILLILAFVFSISCLPNMQMGALTNESNLINPHRLKQLNSNTDNQYDISLSCVRDIINIFFESNDISLIKYSYSNNNLYATLQSNDALSSGCFKIKCDNNSLVEENIYTYTSSKKKFVFNQCYDDAFYKGLKYELENNLISVDDAELKEEDFFRQRTDFRITLGEENSSNIISKSGEVLNFVDGNITIKVIDNGTEHVMPLSNVCVRLYDYDPLFNKDELLCETFTDLNGYYSFTFQNKEDWSELGGYDIQVKIYARGKTSAFYKTGVPVEAQIASERISNVETGSSNRFDICVDTSYEDNLNPNNTFSIQVYSIDGNLLFDTGYFNIASNSKYKYSFSDYQLAELIKSVRGFYDVYFTIVGINNSYEMSTGPYNSQYYLINVSDTLDMLNIVPSDFGFADAYPGEETTSSLTVNEHNLTTRRLRCGYIQEEYINLSPRREGYGTAYLEIDFDRPISKLIVDLSFWSDDERYYEEDQPSASIDYYSASQNKYVSTLNLLTVQPALPKDRTKQNTYQITFKEDTSSIRFYAHFEQMTGYADRNKGRISIGNMEVIYA